MRQRGRHAVAVGLALSLLSACGGGEGATGAVRDEEEAAGAGPSATATTKVLPTGENKAGPTTTTAGPQSSPTTSASSDDLTHRPTTPQGAAPDAVVRASSLAAAVSGDDLRRRDAPPAGVPAQLIFLQHSQTGCYGDEPAPAVEPSSSTYEIGDSVLICIFGFDPAAPVSVDVSLPDRRSRQEIVANSPGENGWTFDVGPADPTGAYAITAVQGGDKAAGGFTVELPSAPLIVTLDPDRGSSGTAFRFAVVGSSPNQTVPVDLYRNEGADVYATTLGSVTTDGEARASYRLTTGTDAPAGDYCLVARPFANRCASFVVR